MLAGEWRDSVAGDQLLTEGQLVESICISISGTLEVRQRGNYLGRLEPGQIIGATLALTGSASPVDAAYTDPGRYMRWSLSSIRTFVDKRPELRVSLQALVNRDLAGKVERLAHSIAGPH